MRLATLNTKKNTSLTESNSSHDSDSKGNVGRKRVLPRKNRVGNLPTEITYKDDYNIVVLHQKAINTIDPNVRAVYSSKAYPLVQSYTLITPRAAKYVQIYGEDPPKIEEELLCQRNRIVEEYFDILREFFPNIYINKIDKPHEDGICPDCGMQLQDWTDYYYCTKCNLTCPISDIPIDLADGDTCSTNNTISKSTTDKKAQLRNVINKFEGLQSPDSIPETVRASINAYIEMNNIDVLTLTKEGLLAIMRKLRKEQGIITIEHYLDLNLLHNEITGHPLPNLSHIRDRLYRRYDELLKISNKKESGISLVNKLLFFLLKFLQLEEYPCTIADIPILKTCDCLSNWETEFRRLCPQLSKESRFNWSIT